MQTIRSAVSPLLALGLAGLLAAPALEAQTTTMPSTLRYGSGLLDIPVASVLPHLAIMGTFSGFFMSLDRSDAIDASGNTVGLGGPVDKFFHDAHLAIGLANRVEVGASLQSLNDAASGGNVWGLFGRLQLLRPTNQGIGFAVGGRWVNAPTFGDAVTYQPTRLGIPDRRFRETYVGRDDVSTELSLYGVATAHIRGFTEGFLPEHDLTLALGYGNGMFSSGDELDFYSFADSEGWFFGSALHFAIGQSSLLSVIGEYNGFDVNVGTQLDVRGIRVGAHYLAANYGEPAGGYTSEYKKPKLGILASMVVSPREPSLLVRPRLMDRPVPDTVRLPAPPPDTVRITREVAPPLPTGSAATVCLATGEDAQVLVTAQGDTLVGPSRTSIRTLRPSIVFAGTYAEGRAWFANDEAVTFEEFNYAKAGAEARLECPQIMRVGEHQGVPLFAMRNAERPYQTLYVPVRPGVWQAYQRGLRQTRG